MKTVTNQFNRFPPEIHAASPVLLGQDLPETSVDSDSQQLLETSKTTVQSPEQLQICFGEPLPSSASGNNAPPNQWGKEFQPLGQVTLTTVPTAHAAYYLNRQPQTLRAWASLENGPIRPIRINGRLAWPIGEIKALLNGGTK